MKAPVGPPICTLLPPKTEIMNPAITAVIIPFSGETPDAMAKAIAKGNATIPTIMPAIASALKFSLLYSRKDVQNTGVYPNIFISLKLILNDITTAKLAKKYHMVK